MERGLKDLPARIARGALVLREGGLVVYPTETFYALGALARLEGALARLFAAKRRPEGKSLPLVAADLAQVEAVAPLRGPLARRLAARFWPGPLTLVLEAAPGLPGGLVAVDGTVAVRIPASETARALALAAGGALVSTSANLAGEPPPSRPEEISPSLLGAVDFVLEAGATPGGRPSTLLAVRGETLRLVREGAVPLADIERACK